MASEAGIRPDLPAQTPSAAARVDETPTPDGSKTDLRAADRVTARIVRTDDGEIFTEYQVSGVTVGSIDAVATVLDDR